jgi:succinate dehydrogenase / fumarate reductase cytochrome b subunit
VAVGLHLLQGLESAHRSLGWLEPANAAALRVASRLLALLLGGGFLALPLALAWRGAL